MTLREWIKANKVKINNFFLAAFAVLFTFSLAYAIISWVVIGSTELTFWIPPMMSGMFLMMEVHYRISGGT